MSKDNWLWRDLTDQLVQALAAARFAKHGVCSGLPLARPRSLAPNLILGLSRPRPSTILPLLGSPSRATNLIDCMVVLDPP